MNCSICWDTKRGHFLELNCEHSYHIPCLREYLRTLRRSESNALLPCPNCRTYASDNFVEILLNEHRCLIFRYTFPISTSMNPTLKVQVAISPQSSEQILMRSSPMKVSDLPQDPDDPRRKFLLADFEVVVQDPEVQFSVWVEQVENNFKISPIFILGTTSLEMEEEETGEEEITPNNDVPPRTDSRVLSIEETQTFSESVQRLRRVYRRRYSRLQQAQNRVRRIEVTLRQAQENAQRAQRLLDETLSQIFD